MTKVPNARLVGLGWGLLALVLTAELPAQGPTGDEQLVNTTTTGDQVAPAIDAAPDGRAG